MSFDRSLVRPLVVALGVLLLVVGLAWALGGFRPAQAAGRPTPAGQPIDLQRWTITVESCAYVDRSVSGDPIEVSARVSVRIRNRTERTIGDLSDNLLTARLGTRELAEAQWSPGQLLEGLNFDPDVTTVGSYDFPLPRSADPTTELTVLVHRERNRANLVFNEDWAAEEPAAAVTMRCADHRKGHGRKGHR